MEYYLANHETLSVATRFIDPSLDILLYYKMKDVEGLSKSCEGVIYYGNYGDYESAPYILQRNRDNGDSVDYYIDIRRPDLIDSASFYIWSWKSIKNKLPARFFDRALRSTWVTQITNKNGMLNTLKTQPMFGGNVIKVFDILNDQYGPCVIERNTMSLLEEYPTLETMKKLTD